MKRFLALAGLALAAAVSPTVLPASPASATEFPDCQGAKLCVWTEPYFKGDVAEVSPGGGCVNAEKPIRSAANTGNGNSPGIPVILVVYSGKDCTGDALVGLGRGESAPTVPRWSPPRDGLSTFSAW